jgi:hypothetical protein
MERYRLGQPVKIFKQLVLIVIFGLIAVAISSPVGATSTDAMKSSTGVDPGSVSPNWNPPYPRIGQVTFYGIGSGDEIWKNHDLIAIRYYFGSDAQRVKAKNPDGILLAANTSLTPDFEGVDDHVGQAIPEDWYVHDNQGNRLPFWSGHITNITNLSPAVDFVYGPQKFNEFLPQYLANYTDWTAFDGTLFDTWWSSLKWFVSDLDSVEPGVVEGWGAGKRALVSNLRSLIDLPVIAHEEGRNDYLNGNAFEFWTQETVGSRSWNMQSALELQETAVQPVIVYANSEAGLNDGDFFGAEFRADFTSAQIAGAYFGHDEGTFAHRYTYLHDEYAADLGYPISGPRTLESGLWVRNFDNGVIISNISGQPKTVTSGQLTGGPYWRFQGAQNPSFNDGSPFTSVDLEGVDGIMLFNQPTTLVTPIVIDNMPINMTSLDQDPAEYHGDWVQTDLRYTNSKTYYGLGYGWDEVASPYARSTTQGTATYRASIKVPGQYEVFEWHPDTKSDGFGSGCTDVGVNIQYSSGSASQFINQQINTGQWNSVGVYEFSDAFFAEVTLTAPGGCTTASDAIRFVWAPNQVASTFLDVPFSHWAHDYIETLYQSGYVSGCSNDPLLYCPEATMTRAESAVFVERGIHGAGFLPSHSEWFAKWATGLWDDGFTAGCGTDPLIYCPLQGHTRAEGSVFFLRMMHGSDYVPPDPGGIFADVSSEMWYADDVVCRLG